MSEDRFRLLQEADWGRIGKRLVLYAEYRARIYPWRIGGSWNLGKGQTPEDIVQDVIVKALTGERTWDPARVELWPWLKKQVDSMIDHLAESVAAQSERGTLLSEEGDDLLESMTVSAERIGIQVSRTDLPDNPEDVLFLKQLKAYSERIQRLFELVSGREEDEAVLTAIIEGCEPVPRFLAEWLNVPINDINNCLKRLRRLALKEVNL